MKPQFDYFFLDDMTPDAFMAIVDSTPSFYRFVDEDEQRMHICIPKEKLENPANG